MPGGNVARREGGLFYFGEEVVGVAVKLEASNLLQWVVCVGPNFSQVKRVPLEVFSLFVGHRLDVHCPGWVVSFVNGFEHVFGGPARLDALKVLPLFFGEVFDALVGEEVELDPGAFVVLVDEAEGMAAIAVDMSPALGCAAIAHQPHYLMQALGHLRPKIPPHFILTPVALRVFFLRADEVHKDHRVAHKEDGCAVADHIPVAFFGVELDGEATQVAIDIGAAFGFGDGRESGEDFCFFTDFAKELGFGEMGDVVGDGKGAISACADGMDDSLGDALAVKVCHFL